MCIAALTFCGAQERKCVLSRGTKVAGQTCAKGNFLEAFQQLQLGPRLPIDVSCDNYACPLQVCSPPALCLLPSYTMKSLLT